MRASQQSDQWRGCAPNPQFDPYFLCFLLLFSFLFPFFSSLSVFLVAAVFSCHGFIGEINDERKVERRKIVEGKKKMTDGRSNCQKDGRTDGRMDKSPDRRGQAHGVAS